MGLAKPYVSESSRSWASNLSFSHRKTYIFVSWKPLEPAWALLADPERLLGLVRGFLGLARGLLGLFWASPGPRHKAPGHLQALFWGAEKLLAFLFDAMSHP